MSYQLPEFVCSLLESIATSYGFSNYNIETSAGSKYGDGMSGIMIAASIAGDREFDGKIHSEKLHLVCKLTPSNPERRKEFMTDVVFEREALAYNQLLPMLVDFQREKGLTNEECFNAYPKCYAAVADATKNEYAVIMEDLRSRGYVLWPKGQSFDNAHAFTVIEGLAKFHATSFALKDQRPDDFKRISNLSDPYLKFLHMESGRKLFGASYERAKSALKDPKHIAIAEELCVNMLGVANEVLASGDEYSILSHGDCWINNMLFKYTDDTVSCTYTIYHFSN